jgi:protein-S-isoprenylcysteine O-methyltransferase Ste14
MVAIGPNISETVLTKAEHELVMHGPYRWIRHPLYTSATLTFVSLGLIASNWFILLMAATAAFAIRVIVIPREEKNLEGRFGEDYRTYRARTGALLPRIW